jgi:hypothetical protein
MYDDLKGHAWNFSSLESMHSLEHCSWVGVVCCMTDETVTRAVASGALLSAGRSGWRHMAVVGTLDDTKSADELQDDKLSLDHQVGFDLHIRISSSFG